MARSHSFLAGGRVAACLGDRGARGQPALAPSSGQGAGRTCCPGLPPTAAPEAGNPYPERSSRAAFVWSGRPAEAWRRRPAAPSGSGKPDPAPRPGRGNFHSLRYLVTRPRCHQSEECK